MMENSIKITSPGKIESIRDVKSEISNIDIKDLIERETGKQFNSSNKMCCPFHDEKTASFSVKDNKYKCFGCEAYGDSVDFIQLYKKVSFIEALEYLGIKSSDSDTVNFYNDKALIKKAFNNIIDIYSFENTDGNIQYYKVKVLGEDGRKDIKYCYINDGKVIFKRKGDELPYNLKEVKKAETSIYIVEGEKDADTLKRYGYKAATSLKGIKSIDPYKDCFKGKKAYIMGDTGKAGEQYIEGVYHMLKDIASSCHIVQNETLEVMGDNKDITDYIEHLESAGDDQKTIRGKISNLFKDAWNRTESPYWIDYKKKDNRDIVPVPSYRNLNLIFKKYYLEASYNIVSREKHIKGAAHTGSVLVTEIQGKALENGLKLSKEETSDYINILSKRRKVNSFWEMMQKNRNDNKDIIDKVWNCITFHKDYTKEDKEFYKLLFLKWCIGVVKQQTNTLEDPIQAQGVLTLQGKQGSGKTSFFKYLFGNNCLYFKDGITLDLKVKDSVIESTKYICSELGELDGTFKKSDIASLKAFITRSYDEFRGAYEKNAEKHARITSYCASVNTSDFLRDETGDRRFWVIPVESLDLKTLENISKSRYKEFWGAIYQLYLDDEIKPYLVRELGELERLSELNSNFRYVSDIYTTIEDTFDQLNWEDESKYRVYGHKEIADYLELHGANVNKYITMYMESRGIYKKVYRIKNGITKKGFFIPYIGCTEKLNYYK